MSTASQICFVCLYPVDPNAEYVQTFIFKYRNREERTYAHTQCLNDPQHLHAL